MDKRQFAQMLNGRTIGDEITEEESKQAEKLGLVVIFGASDDLAEIRGAIDDEVSVYNGGDILFSADSLYKSKCRDEDCPHEGTIQEHAPKVKAKWGGEYSWSYETNIPHEVFHIVEDGQTYCRGIVFDIEDLLS